MESGLLVTHVQAASAASHRPPRSYPARTRVTLTRLTDGARIATLLLLSACGRPAAVVADGHARDLEPVRVEPSPWKTLTTLPTHFEAAPPWRVAACPPISVVASPVCDVWSAEGAYLGVTRSAQLARWRTPSSSSDGVSPSGRFTLRSTVDTPKEVEVWDRRAQRAVVRIGGPCEVGGASWSRGESFAVVPCHGVFVSVDVPQAVLAIGSLPIGTRRGPLVIDDGGIVRAVFVVDGDDGVFEWSPGFGDANRRDEADDESYVSDPTGAGIWVLHRSADDAAAIERIGAAWSPPDPPDAP